MRSLLSKKHNLPIVLSLLLIAFLHLTYIPNGFVWLDHGDIEARRTIVPLSQLLNIFFTPFGETSFYRPLVTLFNSIDFAIYKNFAPGYHFTNYLLFLAVVVITPLFLSAFFKINRQATIVILLIVGLHPLGAIPLGAISYRPELLLTLLVFLTVWLHAKAKTTQNPNLSLLTALSFFLALMAKETAMFLVPALIIFWECLQKNPFKKQLFQLYLPELLILVLYIFLHVLIVPNVWGTPYFTATLADAIGTRLYAFEKLIYYFFVPWPKLSDAVPLTSVFSLYGLTFLILLSIVCAIVYRTGFRSDWSKTLILFTILLAPALAIVPVPRLGSPHYGFIALSAFAMMNVMWLRIDATKRWFYYLGTMLVIMAALSLGAGFLLRNDETLFQMATLRDPHFLEGYFYLGNYYAMQGNYPQAEKEFKRALQEDPQYVAYHEHTPTVINLALVQLKLGKKNEAIQSFESVLPLPDAVQNRKLQNFVQILKAEQKNKP